MPRLVQMLCCMHSELQEKADDLQGATTVMEGRICELHAKVDELQSDLNVERIGKTAR